MAYQSIFSLFAQKYLFRKERLQDRPTRQYELFIDSGLGEHWEWFHRNGRASFFAEINRDYDLLIEKPFKLFSELHPCVIQEQPSWDMANPFGNDSKEMEVEEEIADEYKDRSVSGENCRNWRMEHMAYYCPAHVSKNSRYGIHLTRKGVAHVARRVHQMCPQQPIEIIIMSSIFMLYAHEICHAWVEDLSCMVDFSSGEREPKARRAYTRTNNSYNFYIFMEEAICNTAAYGALHKFLIDGTSSAAPTVPLPKYNYIDIIHAFGHFMIQQPFGYNKFQQIDKYPWHSVLFIENFCLLLSRVYHFEGRRTKRSSSMPKIAEAVGCFFGCDISPEGRLLNFRNYSRWESCWAGQPPVHEH